ncbi:hypothetical protein Tco_0904266 [Tanacetum coccineum]
MPVENTIENALIAQDGNGGYDWSYQAEEEHPTNFALMAYTSSGSSSRSDFEVDSYSKTYIKAYASLKEEYDSLSLDYKKSQFNLVSYKAGLQSVEERLAHYKKNEVVFEEKINVLNLEVKLRDNALVKNQKKLEKAEKESDELKPTLEKFQNSSKSLNNLLESQVYDKFKTGLGYNAASPTVERNFMPPKPDQMFIDEQVESMFVDVVASSEVNTVESKHETVNKGVFNTIETNTVRKNGFSPTYIRKFQNSSKSLKNLLERDLKRLMISCSSPHLIQETSCLSQLDLIFIDEQVESEFMDTVSNEVNIVESNQETADKGVVETNTVRKNSFSPLIIED